MILNGSHVIVLSFQFIAQSYWSIEQKIKQKRNKYKEKKNTAHKIIFFWHSSSITWVRLETKWKLSKEIWINFEFSIKKKRKRESNYFTSANFGGIQLCFGFLTTFHTKESYCFGELALRPWTIQRITNNQTKHQDQQQQSQPYTILKCRKENTHNFFTQKLST